MHRGREGSRPTFLEDGGNEAMVQRFFGAEQPGGPGCTMHGLDTASRTAFRSTKRQVLASGVDGATIGRASVVEVHSSGNAPLNIEIGRVG